MNTIINIITTGDSTRDGRNRDLWMKLSLGPYLRDGWTLA